MDIFAHLNPPQREAVEHTEGPLLILAGAGSGKTRVLTARIAHLIEHHGVAPGQILAMTFTNKAAAEMRERVERLVADRSDFGALTLSTFHSLGARLLRRNARALGLSPGFTIYDDDDQRRLIRQLLDSAEQDTDRSEVRRRQAFIEEMKNQGRTPDQAHEISFSQAAEEEVWFYERYQKALRENNAVDFGDLILGMLELFRDHPHLAQSYSERWQYVMVDEFQDTNLAQLELLTHLTSTHKNLAVVGDDDQSIYRWRGATVANILDFERHFPGARVIKLEQNYRSTQLILDAANDVIRHNPHRHDKRLWTERAEGEPIRLFTASSDREEASYVAETIERAVAGGQDYHDFAVFYRTNAQGRQFEEQLRHHGIPYQLVGGTSFYAREEIKDLLAYLRVALNPRDEVSLLRVVNTPTRGVGKVTIQRLCAAAPIPGLCSAWGVLRHLRGVADVVQHELFSPDRPRPRTPEEHEALAAIESLGTGPREGLARFYETIEALRDDLAHFDSLASVVRSLIERLYYFDYLQSSDPERAEDRAHNVAELINALEEFERDVEHGKTALTVADTDPDDGGAPAPVEDDSLFEDAPAVQLLRAFLDRSALVQNTDDDAAGARGRVTLMTVHGSKGLEFDTVFLAGMEDELFPSRRKGESDPEQLEEERRLAYVALTRAQNRLYITNARRRRVYGKFKDTEPSPFVLDIAPERITIDPASVSREINYKQAGMYTGDGGPVRFPRSPLEGGVDRSLWDFDQSPEMIRGQIGRAVTRARAHNPNLAPGTEADEFSQLPPAWDDPDLYASSPPGEAVQWSPPTDVASRRTGAGASRDDGDDGGDGLVGSTVSHTRFGIGQVLSVSGSGDKALLTVDFPGVGEQTVIRKFVKVLG